MKSEKRMFSLERSMKPMFTVTINRPISRSILITLGILICLVSARSATVVYVGSAAADGTTQQLQTAAQFYGLDLVTIRPEDGEASILKLIRKPETVAVVVDAHALSALD